MEWRGNWLSTTVTVFAIVSYTMGNQSADAKAITVEEFGFGEIVPDHVLAQMRGRFVDGSQLTYFGIGLYSLMVFKDEILSAQLELGVNLTVDGLDEVQKQFRPVVSFFHTCPTCTEPSTNLALGLNQEDLDLLTSSSESMLLGVSGDQLRGVTLDDLMLTFGEETGNEVAGPGIGGFDSVRGVGQVIQAGGIGSNIAQDIELLIISDVAEGSVLAPNGPVGLPQEADRNINIEFDSGARISAIVEDGRFGIKMSLEGGGELSNMIRSGLLAQQARAIGDFATIRNTMVINARRDILSPLATRAVSASAIGALTGISR